ncbi:MAG: UDP-N-acetylmuramate dehydrogenase [Acidimicrobiales bacterium]
MADAHGPDPTLPGGVEPQQVAAAMDRLGPLGQTSVPLGPLTTYRVGGAAAVLSTVRAEADLRAVAAAVRTSGLPILVIGRGSNLLVSDRGFGGIAVVLDPQAEAFGGFRFAGTEVEAGAAVPLPALARRSVEAGLGGLEWAVGVPGSVGGGVRMNAGGHGSDMARVLVAARIADVGDVGPDAGMAVERTLPALEYRYRHSSVTEAQVVLSARFALVPGDADEGRETIREIVRWRREHQPGGQNAGSVFTNPAGEPPANSSGWLIETAGLKGLRQGTAMVSPKHANFIQADPGGSADDVWALIEVVRARVEAHHGIRLATEVRRIGFPTPDDVSTSTRESES